MDDIEYTSANPDFVLNHIHVCAYVYTPIHVVHVHVVHVQHLAFLPQRDITELHTGSFPVCIS